MSKAALTLTVDAGCESGGVASPAASSQYFLGFMAVQPVVVRPAIGSALTIGGGAITNPGRYLVLMPPINGATAISGTPYFTRESGRSFQRWDASVTLDYMPSQFVTFRVEGNHRAANVPYFSGPGGVTPPGGNTGPAGSIVPDGRRTCAARRRA